VICLRFEKTLKRHQYGYQMKGLGPEDKNMLFFESNICLHFVNINNNLFTFLKNAKTSSIWVSNERSRPRVDTGGARGDTLFFGKSFHL
jgi:hypothetical protein